MPGAGSVVFAGDTPAVATAGDLTDEAAFTSITYIPGAVVVGTTFTAPTSGSVLIFWGARFESNTVPRAALVSVEVREGATVGSGTVVSAANDDSALETIYEPTAAGASTRVQASRHRVVTGLVVGLPYNVRTMHRMQAAGNGDIFARDVAVIPCVT